MATKAEIRATARSRGYDAVYLGNERKWIFTRIRVSGNTRAFDSIVFANMVRDLGIADQVIERPEKSKS